MAKRMASRHERGFNGTHRQNGYAPSDAASRGVNVKLATDSLTDHWSPFGSGDQLEKAGRFAELYGYNDERSLSQSLGFITGGVTPLDTEGSQVWPKVGDAASFVLVQASCSAEAVARKSARQAVWYKGQMVSGTV